MVETLSLVVSLTALGVAVFQLILTLKDQGKRNGRK